MKRLIGFIAAILVMYSVYADLTEGTLPKAEKHIEAASSITFEEVFIQPGDTVLSIVEKQGGFPDVSIEKIINDFRALNNGMSPEQIQPGKVYKIPVYISESEEY